MKVLDRVLRRWRYRVVAPYIPPHSVLLDIGGYDGSLFHYLGDRIAKGICLDPLCPKRTVGRVQFVQGSACSQLPFPNASFDVVTLLAVLEHVEAKETLAAETFRVLRNGGRLVATVPHPAVDDILKILVTLKLADGMALEEHHHFDVRGVTPLFTRHGFVLTVHRPFQGGLNHLFCFQKPDEPRPSPE